MHHPIAVLKRPFTFMGGGFNGQQLVLQVKNLLLQEFLPWSLVLRRRRQRVAQGMVTNSTVHVMAYTRRSSQNGTINILVVVLTQAKL